MDEFLGTLDLLAAFYHLRAASDPLSVGNYVFELKSIAYVIVAIMHGLQPMHNKRRVHGYGY
jgi:hypothetical protein